MDQTYRFNEGNFIEQTTGSYSGLFRTPYDFQSFNSDHYAIYFPGMEASIVVTYTSEHSFVYEVDPTLLAEAGFQTGDIKAEIVKIFKIYGIEFEEGELTDLLVLDPDLEIQ